MNLDLIAHIFYQKKKNLDEIFGSTNLALGSKEAFLIKQLVLVLTMKSYNEVCLEDMPNEIINNNLKVYMTPEHVCKLKCTMTLDRQWLDILERFKGARTVERLYPVL